MWWRWCRSSAAGSKTVANCTKVDDGSRAGRDLIVSSGTSVTALLTVSGTSNSSKNQVLTSLSLGDTQLFSNLTLAQDIERQPRWRRRSRHQVGTSGTVKAYIGGNNVSPLCAANNASNVVCLVSSSLADDGDNIALGGPTFNTRQQRHLPALHHHRRRDRRHPDRRHADRRLGVRAHRHRRRPHRYPKVRRAPIAPPPPSAPMTRK